MLVKNFQYYDLFEGILLSRIKVPNEEIKQAIANLDEKTLSLENSK